MFGFLGMMNNYEDRKVANDAGEGWTVDTCSVTDSDQPYETGIKHTRYNEGEWIIVQMYDDKEAALKGHATWVKKLQAKKPPATLQDVSTCDILQLADALDVDLDRVHEVGKA